MISGEATGEILIEKDCVGHLSVSELQGTCATKLELRPKAKEKENQRLFNRPQYVREIRNLR